MDDLSDFFDFSKPFKRITVPNPHTIERITNNVVMNDIVKREKVDDEYSKYYRDAQRHEVLHLQASSTPSTSKTKCNYSHLNDLNYDSDEEMIDIKPERMKKDDPIYTKYDFDHHEMVELPINECKMKIMSAIRNNSVVVLQGDTGCGKTTQIPQFILDDAYNRQEYCNIICTQPRRIAAISIADRVCAERKWEVGTVVGYQVGLHAKASEDTRLLYCTTGILLQKLIKSKDMSCYTHVILDEVHERDQDMDFLLIVVRKLLTTNSRNVKVLLMSATINTTEFSDYFKVLQGSTLVSAPVIKVDSRRLYSVSEFYLDDLGKLIWENNNLINYEEPGISEEMYNVCLKLINMCVSIGDSHGDDDDDDDDSESSNYKSSILVFLPGINEIEKMYKKVHRWREMYEDGEMNPKKIRVIKLHSLISPDEQKLVFRKPPPNTYKIILATNIAESSITVPDIQFVIDFCLTKYLINNSSTNLSTLQLSWAARSNCKQRAGRAGRVMHGRVYRLVSKKFYMNLMDEQSTPEMIRCPLANIILKAKLLDMGPPPSILALAMDPPNLSDIRNTILTLKELGALFKTVNDKYEEFDGDLTYIGRIMAALPIDVHLSRLIIFGYVFSVLEETIIIAAGLSVKSIFSNPLKEALSAYSQKLAWSDGSGSDLFAIYRAYTVWSNMKRQRNFNDEDTEISWARRYYINTKSMREMNLLYDEIRKRLERVGIKELTGPRKVKWLGSEKTIVLKIVIAGAFYPNYFLRTPALDAESEREVYRVLDGRDPCNTVYFSGFESKYIGQLYIDQIKNIFKQASIQAKNIEVRFEEGSQKVYITFKNDVENDYNNENDFILAIPGRIRSEVYKAVKIKQLRLPTTIKVMHEQKAILFAKKKNLGVIRDGKWVPQKKEILNPELVIIPSLYTKTVKGKVTHIEHCGKFWFQPSSEESRLREYLNDLNGPSSDISPFDNASEISKGIMVAAPIIKSRSKTLYHRAKILNPVENQQGSVSFRVLFVDYGNFDVFEFGKLRQLGRATNRLKDIPPRVFECYLAGIQPSSIKCPQSRWPNEAIDKMQRFVDRGVMEIEVYSVVNGITSAILKNGNIIFNDLLVNEGFAQYSEENYMSKADHDNRERKQRIQSVMRVNVAEENDAYIRSMLDDNDVYSESAPIEMCGKNVFLRGPNSPLETQVYAAVRVGNTKRVTIEGDSVNSVLLDSDPQDRHERLLVAANVTESGVNGLITARQTTIMPNIPGFAPLMGLIFCPTMQLRRDEFKTTYVSILTGLGAKQNGQSLFEEHDIVFNLDVLINCRDLEIINHIRYSMDAILHTEPGHEEPVVNPKLQADLKAKIKDLIIQLLEKPRKYIQVHVDIRGHMWNQNNQNDDEDNVFVKENMFGSRSIFPMHSGLRLYSESAERVQKLRTHCNELHNLSKINMNSVQITCQLCDQHLQTIVQLRIHLLSQLHRDREYQIGFEM